MQMSQEGIDALLKKYEGCKLKAYRCPAGICTIGYGHTAAAGAPPPRDGMTITQQQANDTLSRDLRQYETAVEAMVHQPLNQHQFDVLVDFAYNAGIGNLKSSTLLKKVNAAQFDQVPAELMKWTKGGGKVLPGLVKRRQAESAWWISGAPVHISANNEDPTDHEHELRVEPDHVPAPSMANSSQGNAALVTAGLGGLGAAKEIAAQAQDASDTANQLVGLLSNPNFLIMSAVIGLAVAIWYFRKQHMEEHGV
ncbi:COG3772 Phage-related lysozyme (muraminidase) [uncultured Caudovirales phage]|uniref:Endolysin n=1 Tax=uncultured Caudovirales phage TaxID=2100421 RepID=A0A6J5L4S9_9CAUD|nr:COG3772 Phage-related lysozyme (muraminidase) [uncultured Caudovirales phage]